MCSTVALGSSLRQLFLILFRYWKTLPKWLTTIKKAIFSQASQCYSVKVLNCFSFFLSGLSMRFSGLFKNMREKKGRRGSFLSTFRHLTAMQPYILPTCKRVERFVSNPFYQPLSKAKQHCYFLVVQCFQISSGFDKIVAFPQVLMNHSIFHCQKYLGMKDNLKRGKRLRKPKHYGSKAFQVFRHNSIPEYLVPAFLSEIAFMILYLKSAILSLILL